MNIFINFYNRLFIMTVNLLYVSVYYLTKNIYLYSRL